MASPRHLSDGQRRRRRQASLIVACAVVVTVSIVAYGVMIIGEFREIENRWQVTSRTTLVRNEVLFELQENLGYGGFIQDFKNFVLRGDLDKLAAAKMCLKRATVTLDKAEAVGIKDEFPDAFNTLRNVVDAYRLRLIIAEDAFDKGYTSNQIDSLVRVNNGPSIKALAELENATHSQLATAKANANTQLQNAVRSAMLGLLIIPLIVATTLLLLRFLRDQFASNAREKQTAAQIASIIDTNPEAMLLVDRTGMIRRANDASMTLLGHDRDTLIGMPITRLAPSGLSGEWTTNVMALFASAASDGPTWRGREVWALHCNGERIPVGISAGVSGEGDEATANILMSDETTRRRYETGLIEAREAAERTLRAKSNFLANISHEVRTPINAIIGLSGLAQTTDLNDQQRDYLTKIHNAGRHLLDVVNDMLDFARIDAGQMQIATKPFDFSDLLEQISTIAAVSAEEKDLELIFRIDRSTPGLLIGDDNRIAQIFSALIGNAVKFTEKGSVVVDVTSDASPGSQRGDAAMLRISVSDTGCGIEPEKLTELFEPFAQGDTSMTRQQGGTGLGLTICRNLVEAMGGHMSATSTPGQGATFQSTIRVILNEDAASKRAVPVGTLRCSDLPVLIVDDSEPVREILSKEIAAHGFPTETAASGAACLDTIVRAAEGDQPFRILLIDWRMPGIDGIAAIGRVVDRLPSEKIPFIFLMTAFNGDEAKTLAEALPVTAFLEKPINTTVLIDALMGALFEYTEPAPLPVSPGAIPVAAPSRTLDRDDAPAPAADNRTPATLGNMNWRGSDAAAAEAVDQSRFTGFVNKGQTSLLPHAVGARVLVVDDNAINRQVAAEMLSHIGAVTEMADSGLEVLRILSEHDPAYYDLVLMDIQMPQMDGVTATKHIKEDPRFSNLPIVALTAHALGEDRDRSFAAGMVGHLTKPVSNVHLAAALNTWVCGGHETDGAAPAATAETPPASSDLTAVEAGAGPDSQNADDADDPTIFDESRLDSLRQLSPGFLEQMLDDFQNRYRAAGRDIRTMLDDKEFEAARRLAHTIKGTSGSLGAQRLFIRARALDMALRSRDQRAEVDRLAVAFEEALRETCETITRDYAPKTAPPPV